MAISQAIGPVDLENGNSIIYENAHDDEFDDSKIVNFDRIIRKLFRSMRFDFEVEIDYILLRVLNKVFGLRNHTATGLLPNQPPECTYTIPLQSMSRRITYLPLAVVVSKETARLVCDDLLLSEWAPSMV